MLLSDMLIITYFFFASNGETHKEIVIPISIILNLMM